MSNRWGLVHIIHLSKARHLTCLLPVFPTQTPSFSRTAFPVGLVLCMVTSHISFHSSLPVSHELAIVRHCIQESKTDPSVNTHLCVLRLGGHKRT